MANKYHVIKYDKRNLKRKIKINLRNRIVYKRNVSLI